MQYAMEGGHLDVLKYLVEQGYTHSFYKSPMEITVEAESIKMTQWLLANGSSVASGEALHKAITRDYNEIVK